MYLYEFIVIICLGHDLTDSELKLTKITRRPHTGVIQLHPRLHRTTPADNKVNPKRLYFVLFL